jgi:ammonium transporter, Amt family
MIGSAAVVAATFATSMAMFYAINAFGLLRVSAEGELHGLDLHEHGVPAYPEYSLHSGATPAGGPDFTQQAVNVPAYGMSARIVPGDAR